MIVNKTRKRVIVNRSRICRSIFLKALGLMFSRPIKDFGLVFSFNKPDIRPLHMFFVFYPIDMLFLDGGFRIVEIKPNFRPFSIYCPKKACQYIVELPKGKAAGCAIGDIINFK